jgi:hypothetical protein
MGNTQVGDELLASLTPFLSSLTALDLRGCCDLNLLAPTYELAPLSALTRLDLSVTNVSDEGMRALAPLTALTHLDLYDSAVSDQKLRLLAPLAARLTHLVLGGDTGDCGDRELIAVSSLTALMRLEMIHLWGEERTSEEGLRALCSLTGLVHLELSSFYFEESYESWRALSSLTAVSHLRLMLNSFSDEGAKVCLTTLTHLDLGDEFGEGYDERIASDFHVSAEGARALGSLVRLTYLDLNGGFNAEGVRALCSLTALTLRAALEAADSDRVVPPAASPPPLHPTVLASRGRGRGRDRGRQNPGRPAGRNPHRDAPSRREGAVTAAPLIVPPTAPGGRQLAVVGFPAARLLPLPPPPPQLLARDAVDIGREPSVLRLPYSTQPSRLRTSKERFLTERLTLATC